MDAAKQQKDVEEKMSFALERKVLDTLSGAAKVEAVFGAPVEREGVTVIPVARVLWAGGAGGGRRQESIEGGGGGGCGMGAPAGYIVVKDGDAEYRPIRPSLERVALAGIVSAALMIVAWPLCLTQLRRRS